MNTRPTHDTGSHPAAAPAVGRTFTARRALPLLLLALVVACKDGSVPAGRAGDGSEWRMLGGSVERTYFNPSATGITADNANRLVTKWRFLTGAIVTAQPVVAKVDLPGAPGTRLVFIASWDGVFYALRESDGSAAWSFRFKPHPGASYPAVSSALVEDVDGRRVVYVAGGMTMYCLDAATGAVIWEFDAGTGCTTCDSTVERNEIESSAALFEGLVYFGMDVNDNAGKGGFYAVDARTGSMRWFFDLASGSSCRPFSSDDVRRFDGYHTAAELGLPADFFATRPGCDFDRTPNQCGNVWSSASIDAERRLLYTASSNCDSDDDPNTPLPGPTMPPYDEAVFALRTDTGEPAWVWRPREVDPEDLSFGAVPNLFTIDFAGERRDVLGVGNKDGFYYVLDRDGTNEVTGRVEPYWARQLVPGGAIGGILASAAVGEGRIVVTSAIGLDIADPQRPAANGLDAATGEILWSDFEAEPSYSSSSGIPGVVFTGSLSGSLSVRDSATGREIQRLSCGGSLGSPAAVVDGTVLVGSGTGERGGNPTRIAYVVSLLPSPVNAFCVAGSEGCPEAETCDDGDACTVDTPTASGCERTPAADGTACSVGDLSGTCGDGVCDLVGLECPKVSQCTRGEPRRDRCTYVAEADGTACTVRGVAGRCVSGNCVRR